MSVRKMPLLIGLLFLILAILACTINIGGPAYPNQRIPGSTEAVAELLASVQTAVAAGDVSGQVTMHINEQQLTSYLASRLQTQASPLFTDPQVFLRDGQIQIYGMAQQG